ARPPDHPAAGRARARIPPVRARPPARNRDLPGRAARVPARARRGASRRGVHRAASRRGCAYAGWAGRGERPAGPPRAGGDRPGGIHCGRASAGQATMRRAVGYPAVLTDGPVMLRPYKRSDGPEWSQVRIENQKWLAPWEATPIGPWAEMNSVASFRLIHKG